MLLSREIIIQKQNEKYQFKISNDYSIQYSIQREKIYLIKLI